MDIADTAFIPPQTRHRIFPPFFIAVSTVTVPGLEKWTFK